MSDKSPYLSRERGYLDEKPPMIKVYSQKDYTELPDPVRDHPIVSNNIARQEFEYTDTDLYDLE